MTRRGLRTLPTYYLFLIVNALLIGNAIEPGHLVDLLPFVVFVQNLAWPHPVAFGEAWSLAVEEIFYLILPLCLLLSGKLFSSKKTAFLSATVLILFLPLAARIITVGMSEPAWDAGIRKVVMFRLDALMVGVLASWLTHETPLLTRMKRVPALALGLSVIGGAVAFFFLNENTLNTDLFSRVLLFPMVSIGCALLIVSGLDWDRTPAIIGRPAEICARWSYALYLAHMPVFHIILWFLGRAQPGNSQGALIRWVIFIAGSVCVAALVERFVERPTLRWRDRIAPR
jgi:peptidoglycan/LPS O-acetylase OafA/YrhL